MFTSLFRSRTKSETSLSSSSPKIVHPVLYHARYYHIVIYPPRPPSPSFQIFQISFPLRIRKRGSWSPGCFSLSALIPRGLRTALLKLLVTVRTRLPVFKIFARPIYRFHHTPDAGISKRCWHHSLNVGLGDVPSSEASAECEVRGVGEGGGGGGGGVSFTLTPRFASLRAQLFVGARSLNTPHPPFPTPRASPSVLASLTRAALLSTLGARRSYVNLV